MVHIETGHHGKAAAIEALFVETFTASEGEAEGLLIGQVARDLCAGSRDEDLHAVLAKAAGTLVGCILFTRLRFGDDPRVVFLAAPVAVHPAHQRRGIGGALMRQGLALLRSEGACAVMTYGDPAYYGPLGFAPISEADAPPPHPLGQPHGWLCHWLTQTRTHPFRQAARCAAALDHPALW
jgi:putative acetyltransferase